MKEEDYTYNEDKGIFPRKIIQSRLDELVELRKKDKGKMFLGIDTALPNSDIQVTRLIEGVFISDLDTPRRNLVAWTDKKGFEAFHEAMKEYVNNFKAWDTIQD